MSFFSQGPEISCDLKSYGNVDIIHAGNEAYFNEPCDGKIDIIRETDTRTKGDSYGYFFKAIFVFYGFYGRADANLS